MYRSLIILICFFSMIGIVKAAEHNASSCSVGDITTAIEAANHGDIINLPECSVTWDGALVLTKAIHLKGAGVNKTIITGNLPFTINSYYETNMYQNYMIRFPAYKTTKSSDVYGADRTAFETGKFEISNMTLDSDAKSGHIYMQNVSDSYFRFYIHDIKFLDCIHVYHPTTFWNNTIRTDGPFFGLISNNEFYGNPFFKIPNGHSMSSGGLTFYNWKYTDYSGTENAIVIENNYFEEQATNLLLIRNAANGGQQCNDYIWDLTKIQSTGNLIVGRPYKVKTTQANNYFCGSCPVGTSFVATSAVACNANNTVYNATAGWAYDDCSTAGSSIHSANLSSSVVLRYNTVKNLNTRNAGFIYTHSSRGLCNPTASSSTYFTSGVLEIGRLYSVRTTTANNYFCPSCPVGTIFNATAATSLSSSNSVWHVSYYCNTGSLNYEAYGNYFEAGNPSYLSFASLQDGSNIILNNKLKTSKSSASIAYHKQHPESYITIGRTCPTNSDPSFPEYVNPGGLSCSNDTIPRPQGVHRSYTINNRFGTSADGTGTIPTPIDTVESGPNLLEPDIHYFNHNTTDCVSGSSCTKGVGCGTTLPTTCTKGTGFWQTNQSCSSLTAGTFGRNPSVKIEGVLYRCDPANTWTQFWTPAPYPHSYAAVTDTQKPDTSPLVPITPSGTQACPTSPTSVPLRINFRDNVGVTGVKGCLENGTTCTSETTYANMNITFTLQNGTNTWGLWGTDVSSSCNESYAYNVKGTDGTNVSDNYTIGYSMESDSDQTDPELSTAVFANGGPLTLTFTEDIKNGGGYANSHWALVVDGSPMDLECYSGWNSTTLICNPVECIEENAVVTLDFTQPVAENSIQDLAGNPLQSFNPAKSVTNESTSSCGAGATSLFEHGESAPSGSTAKTAVPVPGSVELGIRLQFSVAGTVDGIWWYKQPLDTGTHIVNLWCASLGCGEIGTNLATKEVASPEAASGWIYQAFTTPVPVLANTAYAASYFNPSGHWQHTYPYGSSVVNGVISADSPIGMYKYSLESIYPNVTGSTNYWVDVTFTQSGETGPWNVTVSKTGEGCAITSQPTEPVVDEATSEVVITVRNGWAVGISGDCPAGSGLLSGNTYTYTTGEITEDCEVAVTCSEINLVPWVAP